MPGGGELQQGLLEQKALLVQAFLFGLASSLLILAPTIYMFEVYGRVINSRNSTTLAMLTVFVVGTLVVMQVLDWARAETLRNAGDELEKALSARIFEAIFQLNVQRPDIGNPQPLTDLRTIRDFLPSPFVAALPELPAALVFLVLLWAISPTLGTTALAGATFQAVLAWRNEKRTQSLLSEANRLSIQGHQHAERMVRNAEVVRAMGMLPALFQQWSKLQKEAISKQTKASDHAGLFQALTKWVQTVLSSALLGLAAWLVLNNELWGGPAMLVASSVLGGRVLAPLTQAIGQWRAVIGFRDAWQRLDQFLTQVPKTPACMPLMAPTGALEVEGAAAVDPQSKHQILFGIRFSLKPGDVLAVVGASASGKTTLTRLLTGAWPSPAGKVRLSGADVFMRNKAELGPHVGYLPQEVGLLEGSLGDNIARYGDKDMQAVKAAAELVGIHTWIEHLPNGYDTLCGIDGTQLSGGQRQRVGLARALYGRPVFVVLDEPNSHLDDVGEMTLLNAVSHLSTLDTTFVIITHRKKILAACTHVLVLHEGKQQVFGPKGEVLGRAPVPEKSNELRV